MSFGRRKESVLDRRLREIEREISRLNRRLKGAASHAQVPTPHSVGGAEVFCYDREVAKDVPAETIAPGAPQQKQEPDLFEHIRKPAATVPNPQLELFDSDDTQLRPVRSGRERFASYFMAGHFQDLRPLRQERRVLRNKAIFMLAMAVVLVVWLIVHFIFLR